MIIKHLIFYGLFKVFNGGLSFAQLYFSTNTLSIEEYGVYSLALTTCGLLTGAIFQWLISSSGRLLGTNFESNKVGAKLYIILGLFLFPIVVISYLIISHYVEAIGNSFIIGLYVTLCPILVYIFNIIIVLYNLEGDHYRYNSYVTLRSTIATIFFVFCWALQLDVENFLLAILASYFVAIPKAIEIFSSKIQQFLLKAKHAAGYGYPFFFTYLAVAAIDYSSRFFLSSFIGAEAVGAFSACFDFAQLLNGSLLIIGYLVRYPSILKDFTDSDYIKLVFKMKKYKHEILVTAAFGFLLSLLVSNYLNIIIGKAFVSESSAIFIICSLAIILNCIKCYYFDIKMILYKNSKLISLQSIFVSLINLVLNYILIGRYGIIGSAVSILITFGLSLALAAIISKRYSFLKCS